MAQHKDSRDAFLYTQDPPVSVIEGTQFILTIVEDMPPDSKVRTTLALELPNGKIQDLAEKPADTTLEQFQWVAGCMARFHQVPLFTETI